jgi:hypothetical protein
MLIPAIILEQLARQVRGRPGSERGHGDLARIGLGVGDQLGDAPGWERWMRNQHHGVNHETANRRDVAPHVEWQVLEYAGVDERRRPIEQQRVAVGR